MKASTAEGSGSLDDSCDVEDFVNDSFVETAKLTSDLTTVTTVDSLRNEAVPAPAVVEVSSGESSKQPGDGKPTLGRRHCSWNPKVVYVVVILCVISLALVVGLMLSQDNDNSKGESSSLQNGIEPGQPTSTPVEVKPLAPTATNADLGSEVDTVPVPAVTATPSSVSVMPSSQPSAAPVLTNTPSSVPTGMTSAMPSMSRVPTKSPTQTPTSAMATIGALTTTFYVLGDAPYNAKQAGILQGQMSQIPADAEFVVHVGDIREAGDSLPCISSEYTSASDVISLSHAPVFMILGDNEWNDCPNYDEGLSLWQQTFGTFDSMHWNHTFSIVRPVNHTASFSFVHKYTLFIGLNLVGGTVLDVDEFRLQMTNEALWAIDLIRVYDQLLQETFPLRDGSGSYVTGRVVLFGHAFPKPIHDYFFDPLNAFISGELLNRIPMLYLNGDNHEWMYEPSFFGQPNFLRIMVNGTAQEAPTRISITATGQPLSPEAAFLYERRL